MGMCVHACGLHYGKVSHRTNGVSRELCSFMKIKLQRHTINETFLMSVKFVSEINLSAVSFSGWHRRSTASAYNSEEGGRKSVKMPQFLPSAGS